MSTGNTGTPTRAEVDALMKRCQNGVGGRRALDDAHSILADCYGTLGALAIGLERKSDVIQRLWRERDDLRAAVAAERERWLSLCEQALDALEYHTALTRPIDRTDDAIAALRERLGSCVYGGPNVGAKLTARQRGSA
jgi:hypothetical protein